MRLKRVISAILCIVMTMSVLSGCANTNSTNTESDSKVSSTETVVNDAKDNGDDSYANEISDSNINLDANFVSGAEGLAPEQMQKDEKEDIITALVSANNKKKEENGITTENKQEDISEVPFDLAYPEVFNSSDVEYADNAILIKLKDTYSEKTAEGLKSAGIGKMEVMFELEGCKWYTAYLLKGTDVNTAMDAVREVPGVLLAEYNYKYETAVSSADAAEAEVCNNPKYHDQWPREKFGIKKAWGHYHDKHHTSGGSSAVTVAVIDTGVDYEHVDLKANMWKNIDEVANNGIDDDKNGYVDDYYGIDMTAKKGSGMDDNGHGTHVAGIIGASNNKEGMVGYAFNTKIMTVKAGDASGYFLQNNIAEAIIYAYDNGANVINMSFGGSACSIAVQDALAVAYTRCVLVASAGNDAAPNEGTDSYDALPNYPAALSYVLGVMSVDETMTESSFTNWDVALYNSVEYEVYAPGDQIISTLPGNRYGKLSGTSMAAPVVAAQAALLRSFYSDADTYPTKFIYGQIVGTAEDIVKCNNPEKHTVNGMPHNIPGVINFYDSMTELPTPDVGMSDYTVFDTETYVADTKGITEGYLDANNGDGVIDAGETIALGLTLKNRWGMSENTIVHIDATSEGGVEHPYVTFLNNDINYESVGTYSENDSGKLYSDDGELWTGWEKPFYIHIDKDCPNDYTVTLNVTITCENGLDEKDNTKYVTEEKILLKVRKGVILPNKISEDMTLTKENYYIIPNSMIVMEGATLTIEEGTKVQFWCSSPEDAYADEAIVYINVAGRLISKGTEEEPVEMFPSEWMGQYVVKIYRTGTGYVSLEHTNVVNPNLNVDVAKNCEFTQNYKGRLHQKVLYNGQVQTQSIEGLLSGQTVEECVFYKLGADMDYYKFKVSGTSYVRCVFIDSCIEYYYVEQMMDCVCYGNNNYLDSEIDGGTSNWTVHQSYYKEDNSLVVKDVISCAESGRTYVIVEGGKNLFTAERFARALGGELACFETAEELNYVLNNLNTVNVDYREKYFNTGIYREDGLLYNRNGSQLIIKNGNVHEEDTYLYYYLQTSGRTHLKINDFSESNTIIEIPGAINITNIELEEYVVDIDTEMTYQISASLTPSAANNSTLIYESQDELIVTVDKNGAVTPVGKGSTSVRVYSPDYAVYNYVTVNVVDAVAVESISIREGDITLDVDDTKNLHVEYTPVYTTKKGVVFTSSDVSVATVNEKGVVTAVEEGIATITATGHNNIATSIQVEVIIPVEQIAFKENIYTTSLTKDDGNAFYPTITPSDATHQELIWESSNPEICYVDEEGKLVKLQNGSATLKATVVGTELSVESQVAISNEIENIDIIKLLRPDDLLYQYDYRIALDSEGFLWIWGEEYYTAKKLSFSKVKDFATYRWDSSNSIEFYIVDEEDCAYRYFYNLNTQEVRLISETPIITNVKNIDNYGDNYYCLLNDGSVWRVTYGTLNQIEFSMKTTEIAVDSWCVYMLTDEGEVWRYRISSGECVQSYSGIVDIHKTDDYILFDSGIEFIRDGNSNIVKDHENMHYYSGRYYYLENGRVYVRGTNYDGSLGLGHTETVLEYKEVLNITDAKRAFVIDGNMYIQTESGKLYATGYGENYRLGNASTLDSNIPTQVIFGDYKNYDSLTVESNTQVMENVNVLEQSILVLDFNEALVKSTNYGSIILKNSLGEYLGITRELDLDKLKITPKNSCVVGETYTLTIPADSVVSKYGVSNEAYEITFVYQGGSDDVTGGVGSDSTEIGDDESEETVEIHATVVDEEKIALRHKWTEEEVLARWNQFVIDGYNTSFYGNVILNRLNEDDVTKWLRITASEGTTTGDVMDAIGFGGNYWGTTNAELIEKQILDFDDYQNLLDINQGVILTEAPETTFPFVVDAYLEVEGEKVDTVGNELVTFVVEFNRDMDTSIDLRVCFGSAYPYADYQVEGFYATPRQWRGTMKLSTIIENGYQYWSVSNGKAAGTSMKLYTDWGRFPFKIDTSSAQALIMQAEVTETGIQLTWEQDEFTTLAGYNVYRSTTEDGQYTKINRTVIPADTKEWFDDTVEPGQKYYYNFTVVESDMTESEPSGKVQATAMDTMAPNIYHSPVYHAFTGSNLVISATVTDNVAISSATLYYRTVGTEEWSSKVMTNNNDKYSAMISADEITVVGIEYYIDATDGITHTYKGTADDPYSITVQVAVADSEKGDVDGNGAVELKDALMLLMAINDRLNLTEDQFARADLDGNGELAAKEALRIMQYVNGTITSVLP